MEKPVPGFLEVQFATDKVKESKAIDKSSNCTPYMVILPHTGCFFTGTPSTKKLI